jgi:hypothetical protein
MAKQPKGAMSPQSAQFLKQVGNLAKPSKTVLTNAMDNASDAAAKKLARKEKAKQVFGTIAAAATPLVGTALNAIPVAGPLLARVFNAVTNNDDEWFSEYTAAGATFNELIADSKLDADGHMRLITPAILSVRVDVLADAPNAASTFQNQYLPIILAYVRKKTNNVLVTAESDYWTAFLVASKLYAIYYTLKKYVELTSDLPTNIPALTGTLPLVNPINFSAMVGVVDSLENYLKITVKLPFAWTEYLRWRFGTMFYSENTGKAGLISYDYANIVTAGASVFDPSVVPASISVAIDTLKASLAATSRAVADIKLAYDDHQIRFDVDKRHYDAKEFNLRCNLNSSETRGIPSAGYEPIGTLLYLDSRLDQNAAVQAITLSTRGADNYAPFHIRGMNIAWYVTQDYTFPYTDSDAGTPTATATMTKGWKVSDVSYDTQNKMAEISVAQGQTGYEAYYREFIGHLSPHAFVAANAAAAAVAAYTKACANYCVNSLQVHNQDFETALGTTGLERITFKSKLLSYDAAIITSTQIDAIHRIALRNLFRGEYKFKKAPTQDPKVVEPLKDLVEMSNEAVEASLPNKIG